jgi:hypothetical protein
LPAGGYGEVRRIASRSVPVEPKRLEAMAIWVARAHINAAVGFQTAGIEFAACNGFYIRPYHPKCVAGITGARIGLCSYFCHFGLIGSEAEGDRQEKVTIARGCHV